MLDFPLFTSSNSSECKYSAPKVLNEEKLYILCGTNIIFPSVSKTCYVMLYIYIYNFYYYFLNLCYLY
jgi:hypothetical protein